MVLQGNFKITKHLLLLLISLCLIIPHSCAWSTGGNEPPPRPSDLLSRRSVFAGLSALTIVPPPGFAEEASLVSEVEVSIAGDGKKVSLQ